MTKVTFTKIKDAEIVGKYKETEIDVRKREVDFRLVTVSPYYIIWKSGKSEAVTKRQLTKLQSTHTWTTDF